MATPYHDALRRLQARADYGRGYVSDPFWGDEAARLGLRRMETLLERFSHPDRQYPIIHVAGSKGKGSTCAFAASILAAAGYRVGLTMSPHLHSFRERIVVGGEMISEEAFASLIVGVDAEATSLENDRPKLGRCTAFELLTTMALVHFAASECDAAVVEVGMGGRLDSTNVVMPAVSVVTPLDYEHTAVLGSSLAEIAANKAGIIKPGRPVVVAEQQAEALAVINEEARRNESPLWLSGRDWRVEGDWRRFTAHGPWGTYGGLRTGIAGDHQMANAALALAAVTAAQDVFCVTEAAARWGIERAVLSGRFEVVMVEGQAIVMDGAHTPLAAIALANTFREAFAGRRAVLVVGTADDKKIDELAGALAPISTRVLATSSGSRRAMETKRVAKAFRAYTVEVEQVRTVGEALARARFVAGAENPVLITGSFNVVSEAREALGLAISDATTL